MGVLLFINVNVCIFLAVMLFTVSHSFRMFIFTLTPFEAYRVRGEGRGL